MARKPQMLKDFLELDWDSESCSAEPDATDTVRRLIDSELGRGRRRLSRKLSASALTRISSVVKMLPLSNTAGSSASSAGLLSRSFSKRMKIHFWRKRGKSEAESEDIDDEVLQSCCLVSPAVSSCSSWSVTTDSDRDFLSDEIKNGSPRASPCHSPPMAGAAKADVDGERKEPPECHSSSEEEKEQLSPLSVMEFPSEGEEEEDQASSPSFHHAPLKLQRTKSQQLLRRIGRLQLFPNPNPVILDRCFASCNDDDMEARRLLQHFTSVCQVSSLDENVERLLVDFFVCSLFSRRRRSAGLEQQDEEARRLILVAREWMEGGRWCGADDYHGETTTLSLREIEEGENGWLRCEAAEEEVAVGLEGVLIGLLMQELVVDLAMS
ncbi:uncharacterized protein LOC122006253 [Zingiber officinale]|uniref:uncharacterized protein LOC122006253 n=1 Tax=Zingiber officinale TaxID=94328 RepID=UPI001C4B4E63|nr:uncharacterized protein LOC122006253 [Zingiber officinale]